jgi:flagellar biosynthesis chaperone FliJ
MMKEHVQNTVDLSDTEKKLDAATKLQASTANEVTAAKARVSAKDLKMEHLRADRDTSPAKLENYNSAVNAYDIAVAHQTAQIDAHNAATADVKEWTAKQTELKAWLAWGEARITNTYQPH